MKAIVTGGNGFIGSYLISNLNKIGFKVINIDTSLDKDILKVNIEEKNDICFHLAAKCIIRDCISNPSDAHLINASGTFRILEMLRKIDCNRFVFFSSSRVLYQEKNIYTATKIYGEELSKAYCQSYGIKYIIIRPSTVYGPKDKSNRLINNYIRNAFKGEDLLVYGNQSKTLDLTYITDFMNALNLILCKGKWNKEYNISNNKEVNILSLAKHIIKKTSSKSKIHLLPKEITQPQKVKVDNSLIKKLGYIQKVKWRDGINKTINYIKNET